MSLAMSPNDAAAALLGGRSLHCQAMVDGTWQDVGPLTLGSSTAGLGAGTLRGIWYHSPTKTIRYSFGKGAAHRAGQLQFTDDHRAFIGTMLDDAGAATLVRGAVPATVFSTGRREHPSDAWDPWKSLTIETHWADQDGNSVLIATYKLGDEDISDRTAVTNADRVTWATTIEMVPSSNPIQPAKDTFKIVVDSTGASFTGTYHDGAGGKYEWQGTAPQPVNVSSTQPPASVPTASVAGAAASPLALRLAAPASMEAADEADGDGSSPDLKVDDLLNVSSLEVATRNGKEVVTDVAQTLTGQYFQDMLINALDDQWVTDFFGVRRTLDTGVQQVADAHRTFYTTAAVPNLGQMIHDNFATLHPDTIGKIDTVKLDAYWKGLGANQDYGIQASQLYSVAYRNGVTGIQPYLDSPDPEGWAKQLYDRLTSDTFLTIIRTRMASSQFANVREQLYEWQVQLTLLQPSGDYASRMLHTMLAAMLSMSYDSVRWSKEVEPYLAQAIKNMLNGNVDFGDDMLNKNAAVYRDMLATMRKQFQTEAQFAAFLGSIFSLSMGTGAAGQAAVAAAGNAGQALGANANPTWWGNATQAVKDAWNSVKGACAAFYDKVGNVFRCLAFAAGAGYLISRIIKGKDSIIEDISLGVLATGLVLKSIESLLATAIGGWLRTTLQDAAIRARQGVGTALDSFLTGVRDLVGWFREGASAENWATRILGRSSAEFFARRMGPILSLIGVGASIYALVESIETGTISDVVFSSLNLAFSIADTVFIGLELFGGFAWAGPLGLAVAILGLLVVAFQFVWDTWIHPTPPPPDPVQQFVAGPLHDAGYAAA